VSNNNATSVSDDVGNMSARVQATKHISEYSTTLQFNPNNNVWINSRTNIRNPQQFNNRTDAI